MTALWRHSLVVTFESVGEQSLLCNNVPKGMQEKELATSSTLSLIARTRFLLGSGRPL